jgi:hypothetical protein
MLYIKSYGYFLINPLFAQKKKPKETSNGEGEDWLLPKRMKGQGQKCHFIFILVLISAFN